MLPTFVGATTINRVVMSDRLVLYRDAAGEIPGVKITELAGPNSAYYSLIKKEKRTTGRNQHIVGITAMADQIKILDGTIKRLQTERQTLVK